MASLTRSIRAPDVALWQSAEAEAKRRGMKVNGWVLSLIREALELEAPSARPAPVKPAARPAAKAAEAVKAAEVATAKVACGYDLQVGPSRAVLGSRLRGANRQPRR
jgi:hypothetical protein